MTELWLVRHGQTDWNVAGRFQGHIDIPLNPTGISQAQALAATLAAPSNGHERPSFSAIYSSDLSRAYQTAQLIAERLGLPVQKHLGLREVNLGEWEGKTREHVHARYPELVLARRVNVLDVPPPGGETNRQTARRAAAAANEIALAYPTGRVLVVSHGITVATLVCQARGFPLEELYHHVPENAAPIVVQWEPRAIL